MNELSAALHWDLLAVADDGAGGGLQPSMGDVSCSITVGAGGKPIAYVVHSAMGHVNG